ncbi:hypothetical protein CR513_46703, partial [Mucuna pruriens]
MLSYSDFPRASDSTVKTVMALTNPSRTSFMVQYSNVLGTEEPHQSIPNLMVKLCRSDNIVGE